MLKQVHRKNTYRNTVSKIRAIAAETEQSLQDESLPLTVCSDMGPVANLLFSLIIRK